MGMDRPAPAARSSKVPATSGKFDPLIGRGSPVKVEIGRLTQPKGGGGGGGFQVRSHYFVWIKGGAGPPVAEISFTHTIKDAFFFYSHHLLLSTN